MRQMVFLLQEATQLLDFAGPYDVFTAANQVLKLRGNSRAELYKITLVSDRAMVEVNGNQNVFLGQAVNFRSFKGKADTVVVLGGENLTKPISSAVIEWLKRQSQQSRRTMSVCTGSFLLAAAGLLDGRRAATHWLFCRELQKRFPEVSVDSHSIYVKDGNIYTSAGVTAGIDLALALVEEDHGPKIALAVARGLVVYLRRPGSQGQFSQILKEQYSSSGPLRELVPWMMENLHRTLSVEELSDRCSMSSRHFARQFAETFSCPPAKFVARLRLESAKSLLSNTEQSIEQIARKCGYSNSDVFRKSFMRSLSMTPVEYRRLWSVNG